MLSDRFVAALLLIGFLGGHAARVQIQTNSGEDSNITVRERNCGRVEGASDRNSRVWRQWECKCPEGQVVTGESPACKALENAYSRYFDDDDANIGKDGACKCAHKPGCGLVKYDVDDVIPANAIKKGLPPPMEVGTRDNINTGIKELDAEYYGLWWMKDNPVPEELASMAGSFSRYTGQNLSKEEAEWPVVVEVPNAEHNRWAWADTWQANNVIMPQYYGSTGKANFTMYTTTEGEIPTNLKNFPLIWVEAWGLKKLDEDTWLRRTTFQQGSLFSETNYTLTRILYEDGSPTKYFQVFSDYMKTNMSNVKLQVWDSDDTCKRKCMLAGKSCYSCHDCCTGGSDGGPRWNCRFGW